MAKELTSHKGRINSTGEPYGDVWECDEDCEACWEEEQAERDDLESRMG